MSIKGNVITNSGYFKKERTFGNYFLSFVRRQVGEKFYEKGDI